MDKSRSRTDLLAAGRKRLQQFRQKKDNKGGSSRGKSSKKSDKPQLPESDADADAASSTSITTGSSPVPDGSVETDSDSNVVITESLDPQSMENSSAPDNIDPSVDSLSEATTYDTGNETELDSNAKLALQVHGVIENDSELFAQDQGRSAQDIDADVAKDVSLSASDILGPEAYDHSSAPVAVFSSPASVVTAVGANNEGVKDGENTEELLLLSEDIPNTFVMQTREDQEADGLDVKKSCQSTDVMNNDQKELPWVKDGESDHSLSGIAMENTRIEVASHEAEQLGEPVELFSSLENIMPDKLSGSDEGQADNIATAVTSMKNQERETLRCSSYKEILLQSNQEQSRKGVCSEQDMGLHEGLTQKCTPVGSAVEDHTHEMSLGAHEGNSTRQSDRSPIFDVSSVNLLKLAEIIRGLNEEEYQFLLEARGAVSDADPLPSSSVLTVLEFAEAFQRLKEDFFLANLMENIFNIQLVEQLELQVESDNQRFQLIGELSQLRASHNEVNEKNQQLTDELANCHFELRDISSKRVEVQNHFSAAMAEVDALSARLVELQVNFEMSQKDSSDLSTELMDCRGLISSLQAEKKGTNETLELVTAEKNKLMEEKEFHMCESTKLAAEVADIKSSTEAAKVENSNLIDMISLLTEESHKTKAEVEHLLLEVDRLSLDLVENKDLVASLQAENSNLNGNLALSADKIKNLEDENHSVFIENQGLSSQIVVLQEQLSIEKGERVRFEGDLQEVTIHLVQLSNENVFLNSTLEEHRAKLAEIGKKHSQPLSQPADLGNQAQITRGHSEGLEIAVAEDSMHVDQEPDEGAPSELEVFNDSHGFVSLKTCLDEGENLLVKLEKAINELHSRSVFASRSDGKVSSPAVSKLIQAFESKVLEDEHEAEERDSSDVQSSSNSLIMFTMEQIENLRKLLSKWELEVQSAAALFKGERDGRKIGDAKYSDLEDQFKGLTQHCSDLETSNIELSVQYEIVKQLLGEIQENKCQLEELYEALKQENTCRKGKDTELHQKLGYCLSKVSELHTEMYGVRQSSNEMAIIIGSQLENLQKEVAERGMQLEQGWNASIAEIVELVGKLNESVGETLYSTISSDTHDSLDISHQLEVSVKAATELIFDLRKKLEATYSEHEMMCTSYKEMNMKCDHLLGRNEMSIGVLHKMYSDTRKLVLKSGGSTDENVIDEQCEALPDLLNYDSYQPIMKHLVDLLNEKLKLESGTKEMKSELMHKETELEELKMKCRGLDSIGKLIEDVARVLNVENPNVEINKSPLLYLDSLVSSLVQKTKEAEIQYHTTKEGYGSKEMELAELKEKMYYLDTLRLENENEILVLRESLDQADEALTAARSELHEKANELEHSEQRLSSIREKLSIAVAKGKGLVVQRDGLKQSLSETSSELERCLQELNLKDTRLHEVETKLKTYAEAGERAEALESELSYIRNSANALRESFLLKDSMLQRIEEVLEDLDLPEQFHSSDIIEKIDWLVRSVAGNSLPMNDWERKDSVGGGSNSDAGYVVTDSWKDDIQLQPESQDDFRKNPEEMQSKYYELAEQNEMLEQSLMERNSLVQRWEELVDRIDMPSHLRSMEMEDRIEWVGRALAEANHHVDSLQLKIEKYDSYCGLVNADLEESQRRVSALQADLRALTSEREFLSEKLEALTYEYEKISVQARGAELEIERLNNEVTSLKDNLEQKAEIEEQNFTIDGRISKLRDLVVEALSKSETEYLVADRENIDSLEELLQKLIESHASLSSTKPTCGVVFDEHNSQNDHINLHSERSIDMHDKEGADIDRYKADLEEALSELVHLKEERDRNLEKQMSLSGEVETLNKRTEELQELVNLEEQKSASVREKLNVAVRKGKSLVQQRDSLKQTIEGMSVEIERLKSEINNRESTLADHEQKLRQLSTYPDRVEALESESLLLKNHLEETEQHLQEQEYSLKLILNKLGEIEVGGEGHISDPVKKLEWLGKLCSDLHDAVTSLEQESRKSKRASELLLAELNEVQERNDSFQDELAKVAAELVDLKKEKDSAEAAKLEALSHLEKLSTVHEEVKMSQSSKIMELKSSMNQVCKSLGEVHNLLTNVLLMDLDSFRNLKAGLESCLKGNKTANMVNSSVNREQAGIVCRSSDTKKSSMSADSWPDFSSIDHHDYNNVVEIFHLFGNQLKEFLEVVGYLKERIDMHSSSALEQDKSLFKLMADIQREITSQRESCETMKKEVSERDRELVALRGNILYLYEACINSVSVLENGKADLVGKMFDSSNLGINLKAPFSDEISEELIKTMADRLLLSAKGFASMKTEFLDANQKEMKATITTLQRELQEKDVQRDSICSELVKQIKDAENAANSCSQDLQSFRTQESNLKKQVEVIESERKILEQRVTELQDRQGAAAELEQKVRSQTGMLAAKDQEIEALMHALDEEEMQMEELTKKIVEVEKVVQQKNLEIENLDSSRSKVMKKLSITVSKFDELHDLSASLLSEVEKLQSQLQEKDSEISFLRQEVTRCTNDVLIASQTSNQRSLDEIFAFLMWVDTIVSQDGMDEIHPEVKSSSHLNEYKEVLHKKLMAILSELENLREVAESKDSMLQVEKIKVEELNRKTETLEKSLHEKALQLNLLEGVEETGKRVGSSSEILEVDEPVVNEWTASGAFVTPQVRSLRKGNNDHVAIAVDEDPGSTNRIEDEEDDKVHGFKSLSSSKIVPRFTRPLTDLVDGLWVSCDRTLMRQPVLRLGIIMYWAIMHALLAFFVV
ncbi:trans-Golgi network-localized SYP41-interacting protein 1 isoform X3 [Lotus japonicus]|uniref:trans-Golgi network-localized SYP41-interacting protein 1 isoform X3 n=1 Tax=Lotus japonicus TaxID=34305 RepID=UPI00258A6BAE|nr:trans-Golgi network-localized SYP41-interacting protein 1 isoform X3 [Lotus japonicus]